MTDFNGGRSRKFLFLPFTVSQIVIFMQIKYYINKLCKYILSKDMYFKEFN